MDIKPEINSNTITVENFNTPFTPSRQKTNNKMRALNVTLDQNDLTDIFRTIHPKTRDYTFFSSAHGNFLGYIIIRPQNETQ